MANFSEKISTKTKAFVKNLKWQDYVFIGILIIYLILLTSLITSFKQLPSPLYGGDYYYSMGTIQHVLGGGSPFVSSNVLGSEPIYLPFYTILVSIIGFIFSLAAFAAMKVFAFIEIILALIVFYVFASKLLKNKTIALISLVYYLSLVHFPVWKYLQFTYTLMLPLYFLTMLYFFEKRTVKSAIFAGILFGIIGISHSVAFVVATLFLIILAIYILFFEHIQKNKETKKFFWDKNTFKKALGKNIKILIILSVIGVAIAMLFWFKPIFVYHGQPLNPHVDFNQPDFSVFKNQIDFSWDIIKSAFFNFSSIIAGITSILFIIGILSIFFLKKYDASKKFLIIFLLTTFIGTFHFILTQPLLGTNLSAQYVSLFTFSLFRVLFIALGILAIAGFAKKYKEYVIALFLVLFLVFNFIQFSDYSKNDQWINAGRSPLDPRLTEMQEWVLSNTDVNDVFLSSNELNFALNGLTGRKQVNSRRAHNSMFLDIDERQMAAAIMLYGNDDEERKSLLKEYSVDYIYWDYYWVQSDYNFDNQGKLTSWFDPLVVHDTPEHIAMVEKYNLSSFRQHTWLDPSTKSEHIKQFDLIFFLPSQFNITHPWHSDLDNYLEEVWGYKQGDIVVSRIYKIINID